MLQSQTGVLNFDVTENVSGFKAVVFLWQFTPLLCDSREFCGMIGEMTINNITKICKQKTSLEQAQILLQLQKRTRT